MDLCSAASTSNLWKTNQRHIYVSSACPCHQLFVFIRTSSSLYYRCRPSSSCRRKDTRMRSSEPLVIRMISLHLPRPPWSPLQSGNGCFSVPALFQHISTASFRLRAARSGELAAKRHTPIPHASHRYHSLQLWDVSRCGSAQRQC